MHKKHRYHTDTCSHFKSEWKRLNNDLTVTLRKVLSTKSIIIIICNPASVVVGTTSMWSGKSPLFSKQPDMLPFLHSSLHKCKLMTSLPFHLPLWKEQKLTTTAASGKGKNPSVFSISDSPCLFTTKSKLYGYS